MDWDGLDSIKFRDETDTVCDLLAANPLTQSARLAATQEAMALAKEARHSKRRDGVAEGFLRQFSLSTPEGLALMGLAEALLRTPDISTQDRLIAERISAADWSSHLGQSDSLLVNASTWGLMLTGRLIDPLTLGDGAGILRQLVARAGEPLVRAAVGQAIRIMGEQFVLGRTIDAAIARASRENLLCSFDMLGEGARTQADAKRYEASYADAIAAIARISAGPGRGHGISVKLSALSPRYEPTQEARVWDELYPRLLRLAQAAGAADVNFTLDAEEADRLVLSLKLLERLAREPVLGSWMGLGLAVQAYQKRAPKVIAALAQLASQVGRRLTVRLVKGAYWDSEIKRAQVAGRPGYPVFTTKPATDLSYLVCARTLIGASPHLFGQFATHNAYTLAAVRQMAVSTDIEFQRLHGMGEALYAAAGSRFGAMALRTYAPVGAHEDLLPYLVRRLLENGANTSFVHQLMDEDEPLSDVVRDPVSQVEAAGPGPHPKIPLPGDLYGDRRNSEGIDFSIAAERNRLLAARISAPAVLADATAAEIDAAFQAAIRIHPAWDGLDGSGRAVILGGLANALEKNRDRLMALLVREVGKTWPDAMGEVREAADFCRYYALLAERHFAGGQVLKGTAGESNVLELHGRGVFACISPWNFPLSIFTGQIAAALAAGNTVVAKPAEQTPAIASEAISLWRAAGLPREVLHLVCGPGETVGAALVGHPLLSGIAFTGGTDTAQAINRHLAARPGSVLPFIAETGGLNAMFVDTTAQREQVIDDVILSAFGSAGQRCSALRILFLPQETADDLIEGLKGAMDVLNVGDPGDFATDVGPVIDATAKAALEKHLDHLERTATILKQVKPAHQNPLLFGPVMAEVALAQMPDREVFGPVLHVIRYPAEGLETAARVLAGRGYGLTLGIHSRLDSFAARVRSLVPAGNTYVNRSIIGAVVGVQPFGGEGLSGTGPKAGGPYSLTRYAVERALSINIAAQGGDPALLNL